MPTSKDHRSLSVSSSHHDAENLRNRHSAPPLPAPNIPLIFKQTGYVGGDFLFLVHKTHPQWPASTTCLVRNQRRAEHLKNAYPNVRLVYGTFVDAEILESEAANADIVLHFASSDHVGAAEAIARGLKRSGGY